MSIFCQRLPRVLLLKTVLCTSGPSPVPHTRLLGVTGSAIVPGWLGWGGGEGNAYTLSHAFPDLACDLRSPIVPGPLHASCLLVRSLWCPPYSFLSI